MESETASLLQPAVEVVKKYEGGKAKDIFLTVSYCFAGVRSSSMLGLFYASSMFGELLGGNALSLYYWTFAGTCLLLSAPITEYMGSVKSLVVSQITMTIYLASYCIGSVGTVAETSNVQWTVVMLGSAVGGFSSGLGWTAQGVYFSLAAAQHAEEADTTVQAANDLFAGYWASIYFGGQCALYIIASLLFEFTEFSYTWCFLALTVGSTLATACMYAFAEPPKQEGSVHYDSALEQAVATLKISFLDPVAVCLQPTNVAYGFTLVFVQVVVSSKVVDAHLGTSAVGFVGAIQAGVVMLLSVPLAKFATSYGKVSALGVGSFADCFMSGAFLFYNTREMGHWNDVWWLFALYGVARTSFESTNKAVFADFFTGRDRAPAFASLNFVRSFAAALLALTVSDASVVSLATCCLVMGALMVPGYFAAKILKERQDSLPQKDTGQ
mmetsp:Transcript_2925/g.5896  ORF Transcript_2925/g.5896 Transcript_2925/m.5896 type:complete len:441 (-) Transcript_2925:327-1649(-)